MLKAPWLCLCSMHDCVACESVTTSSSCYVLTCGDILSWSVSPCFSDYHQSIYLEFLVCLPFAFVWQVRDGFCLPGSECLFDHWRIPRISWRGSPLHGGIGRLLVHSGIHFQVKELDFIHVISVSLVVRSFSFWVFWHFTIRRSYNRLAVSTPQICVVN